MCLLIREATRVAVVGRWGRVPTNWRGCSSTVIGLASLTCVLTTWLPRLPLGAALRQLAGECPGPVTTSPADIYMGRKKHAARAAEVLELVSGPDCHGSVQCVCGPLGD